MNYNIISYSDQEKEDALKRRDVSKLINMINDGIDINSLVIPKNTDILLVALNKKHYFLFKEVLSRGFNCKSKNKFLYVHHAIRTQDIFFVKEIVEHYKSIGLDYNEYTKEKHNCLHIAAMEENIGDDIFIYLTQNGIKWAERDKFGQTPLHILLRRNVIIKEPILNLLKKNKKVFFIKDNLNMSAIDIMNSEILSKEWKDSNQLLIKVAKEIQK